MDFVGLKNIGLMDPEIHPVWKDPKDYKHRFIGIAVTVRYVPTQRPAPPAGLSYDEFRAREGNDKVRVGSLSRDPAFVHQVRSQARTDGLDDRVVLAGPRTGADLDARYAAADLLVLASRGETYGMVATEALARGIPVLATAVGGLPEAIGRAPDDSVPALAVPVEEFGVSLRRWLTDAALRNQLRRSAVLRRSTLTAWTDTTRIIGEVLAGTTTKVGTPR